MINMRRDLLELDCIYYVHGYWPLKLDIMDSTAV